MMEPPAYGGVTLPGDADNNGVPDIYEVNLPAGYEARMAGDRVYWVNHATQESTWDDPRNSAPPPYAAEQVVDANNNGVPDKYESNLPPGWECRMQGDRPYWINHNTQTSSWDDPRSNLTSVVAAGTSAGFGTPMEDPVKRGPDAGFNPDAPFETTDDSGKGQQVSWMRQQTQFREPDGELNMALVWRWVGCVCIFIIVIVGIVILVTQMDGSGSSNCSYDDDDDYECSSSRSSRSTSRSSRSSRGRRLWSDYPDW